MEFDVEIKVTKLVKGKGLYEKLVEREKKQVDINIAMVLSDKEQDKIPAPSTNWVQKIINYLQNHECPKGLDKPKRRYFRLQAIPYTIVDGVLFS